MITPHTSRRKHANTSGFSILEALIATVILVVGLCALLALLAFSLRSAQSSRYDSIAKAKAQEALESVISAKTTAQISFSQIQNTTQGGIFLEGMNALLGAGPDGLIGTSDDTGQEYSSPSGNSDSIALTNFQRQIVIATINPDVVSITVTVQYKVGQTTRQQSVYTNLSRFR